MDVRIFADKKCFIKYRIVVDMSINSNGTEMKHMNLDMVIAELNKPYEKGGNMMQYNKKKVELRARAKILCEPQKLRKVSTGLMASIGFGRLTDEQKVRKQCDTVFPEHAAERIAVDKAKWNGRYPNSEMTGSPRAEPINEIALAARRANEEEERILASQERAKYEETRTGFEGGKSRKYRKRTRKQRKSRKSKKITRSKRAL
jgi:hypothetical protein